MPKNPISTKYKPFKIKSYTPSPIPPSYISNFTLHRDLKMKTIHEEAKTYYKRFFNKLSGHSNPLISGLATHTILGNPPRRLKRN
jgi:hypothetical protein